MANGATCHADAPRAFHPPMERIGVRLIIRGRVQGVGFRAWTLTAARRLRLDGWVRNRADGSVELVATGAPTAVAELSRLCWQGPSAARVLSVDERVAEDEGLRGFEARPSL